MTGGGAPLPAAAVRKTSLVADVRGASRLAVDLTLLVTEVVETMHHNVARRPWMFGRATLEPTRGITGFVYRSVRGVTRVVGTALDVALRPLEPLLDPVTTPPGRDAIVAALNGVLGDRLEANGNPLAIPMELRTDGAGLPPTPEAIAGRLPQARERIVVLVHGLCLDDAMWRRDGHDHGEALARDLDATPLYLRYNTGRHVSTNGGELAALLERLVAAWPVPVHELVLVGHSMGGLVIRSACAQAEASQPQWLRSLRALVFLGTPHFGAPLERGGHGIDMLFRASPYTVAFSRLGQLRSAGITDLRHGSVVDDDWHGRDRFGHRGYLQHTQPLPAGVPAFAVAGSLGKAAPARGLPRGDGLVPVASACGRHADPARGLGIAASRQWVAYGTGHFDLLSSQPVYVQLRRWLRATPPLLPLRRALTPNPVGP